MRVSALLSLLVLAAAPRGERRPGFALQYALGDRPAPAAYVRAVKRMERMLLSSAQFERPTRQSSFYEALTSMGSKLKRPLAERLVPIEDDALLHLEFAKSVHFPEPSFVAGERNCQPWTPEIAEFVLRAGPSIVEFRRDRERQLVEIAASLESLAPECVALMPPHVRIICSGLNIPMMAAMTEALANRVGFPDWAMARLFTMGFSLAGASASDASRFGSRVRGVFYGAAVLSSGLFRRVSGLASHTLGMLFSGRAAPPFDQSNTAWFKDVSTRLSEEATRALNTGQNMEKLRAVEEQSFAEAGWDPATGLFSGAAPTMGEPMTLRQFGRWAHTAVGGVENVRVMRRFAIKQGVREDGSVKWRVIDDAKASGVNAATYTEETITCASFLFVALICRVFYRLRRFGPGGVMPQMWVGLDDLRKAYRMVPNSMPGCAVVAYWSFAYGCVVYQLVPGHSFGFVSAVLNFNRLPAFICIFTCLFFAVCVTNYFDDSIVVDPAYGSTFDAVLGTWVSSAQSALRCTHMVMGFDVELSKHKECAPVNNCLGVNVDLTHMLNTGFVHFKPTTKRVQKILHLLRTARGERKLTPGMASTIRGKLGFVLLTAWAKFGRGASQPLIQREHHDSPPYSWSSALDAMLEFYETVLPNLPDLAVSLAPLPLVLPVIIYTDASFSKRCGIMYCVLAFFVFDPADGRLYYSSFTLPMSMYRFFVPDKKTYIMQGELLAAIAVYFTMPETLRGRSLLHFCDNTGALSALINGTARKPDCALLANTFHTQMFGLRSHIFLDWVPSEANIADWPTRSDKLHRIPDYAIKVKMQIPPMSHFDGPLADWGAGFARGVLRARAPY